VFILFSKDCVSKYWAEICKMKILNSAIYDKKKTLIIPVSAEKNVKMKSRKHGFGILSIRNSVDKIERILRTTYNKPTWYTVVQVLLVLLCKTCPYYDYETYEPISYPSKFPYFSDYSPFITRGSKGCNLLIVVWSF
jgi:hypothetical protein